MKNNKQKLLEKLIRHISFIQKKIKQKIDFTKTLNDKSHSEIKSMQRDEQAVYMNLKVSIENRLVELHNLYQSPYFAKCETIQGEMKESKTYFFAKHQFIDEGIYSWVAPIAAIRFENPGLTSYKLPNGKVKNLEIIEKDQYMIVNGKVMFFAKETINNPRELIYQEHFTVTKTGFILPEIVAQMEKAQDQVIRAHHKGPLVISGPAGSGKTTLALHRIAYLTQAPETASLYSPDTTIVFVQDRGTQEYFSHLLPELGINNVTITTFTEWALKILGIQKSEKEMDRFEITRLLQKHLEKYKKFEIKREYFTPVKGEVKKKIERKPVLYSLIIVDEFQNYLPEQLILIKQCVNETESIVYVGDMSQQIYLGTIKSLDELGYLLPADRNIKLEKVYRNTKNILLFIKSLGYKVEIPRGIKEGPPVIQKILETPEQEIEHIKNIFPKYKDGTVGVLAKEDSYLRPFKEEFKGSKNIHIMAIHEAQGVEFDLVCLVGINENIFKVKDDSILPIQLEELRRIEKDLLYIALTRAITELHLLGKKFLK